MTASGIGGGESTDWVYASWRRKSSVERAMLVGSLGCCGVGSVTAQNQPSTSVYGSLPSVVAFVNVAVIPMDQERVLDSQTVVVRDGRVEAVGRVNKVAVPVNALRIDGRGQFLAPGLADMHVHLPQVSFPKLPDRNFAPPRSDDLAWVEWWLLRTLAAGVTTVRNMDGRPWHLALRERAARGELLSPRIYTTGPKIVVDAKTNASDSRELARRVVAEVSTEKAEGYDFLKMYTLQEGEAFDSLAAAARREKLPIVGHPPQSAITPTALAGVLAAPYASLEHLYGYLDYVAAPGDTALYARLDSTHSLISYVLNGVASTLAQRLDPARLRRVVQATRHAGLWNVPTLAKWALPAKNADTSTSASRAVSQMFSQTLSALYRIVRALHDGGAGLMAGTDDHCIPLAAELSEFVSAGLTPYQALETATRNPAVFLGTPERGTIVVGHPVSLVLLRADPLVDIRNIRQVAGVLQGGRWFPADTLNARLAALDPLGAKEQECKD